PEFPRPSGPREEARETVIYSLRETYGNLGMGAVKSLSPTERVFSLFLCWIFLKKSRNFLWSC
ncbi:MAG: hypothetical protein QXD83_06160, partial [Sulfolobales archaeon]